MRKDWRENMVDPPKTCLWVQSIIREDRYRWETECGKTFDVKERTVFSPFINFSFNCKCAFSEALTGWDRSQVSSFFFVARKTESVCSA